MTTLITPFALCFSFRLRIAKIQLAQTFERPRSRHIAPSKSPSLQVSITTARPRRRTPPSFHCPSCRLVVSADSHVEKRPLVSASRIVSRNTSRRDGDVPAHVSRCPPSTHARTPSHVVVRLSSAPDIHLHVRQAPRAFQASREPKATYRLSRVLRWRFPNCNF
jgi:hypothetical protein